MLIIRKVYENKSNKQLLLTVPKNQGIEKGDYVEIQKVEKSNGSFKEVNANE